MRLSHLISVLGLAALLLLAWGCSGGDEKAAAPTTSADTQKIDASKGDKGSTPGAQTLGIQENPSGTNPGLGSK